MSVRAVVAVALSVLSLSWGARPPSAKASAPAAEADTALPVAVSQAGAGVHQGETLLHVVRGALTAELGFTPAGHTVRFEVRRGDRPATASAVSLGEKVELLDPLFRRFLALRAPKGPLELHLAGLEELAPRLAAAAAGAQTWNRAKGRPRSGSPEAFVMTALNSQHAFPELEAAFRTFDYSIRVSAVEKVEVRPARDLNDDAFASLKKRVAPRDRLPVSALLYFELAPGAGAPPTAPPSP